MLVLMVIVESLCTLSVPTTAGHKQCSYSLFSRAVQQFWLPSRVRCDQGGENYSIALHMLRHRVLIGEVLL